MGAGRGGKMQKGSEESGHSSESRWKRTLWRRRSQGETQPFARWKPRRDKDLTAPCDSNAHTYCVRIDTDCTLRVRF